MKLQSGFTLIELLVTMTILAVLLGVAAPSLSTFSANSALSSQLNSFNADTRFARSEAVKRGIDVSLCPSADPLATEPTCSGSDWRTGWIVFVDTNGNGARSTVAANGESILRRQEAYSNSQSIQGSTAVLSLRYNSEGRIPGGAANLSFAAPGNVVTARLVCISITGRVRITDKGTTAC